MSDLTFCDITIVKKQYFKHCVNKTFCAPELLNSPAKP